MICRLTTRPHARIRIGEGWRGCGFAIGWRRSPRGAWIRSILIFLGLLIAAGQLCAAPDRPRVRVVTTLLPVYCLAVNVGGDRVDVRCLVGTDGAGHDYQLTPRDRAALEGADVFLLNGLGMEPWLKKTLALAPKSLRVLEVSRGLDGNFLAPAGDQEGAGRSGTNGHVWLDPELMLQMVTNVWREFQDVDPAGAVEYSQNAAEYVRRLQALDGELRRGLEPMRGLGVVTFHDAFPYFARRYGLVIVGVIEELPDVDPSARHLARLSARIRDGRARAIFSEPRHSSQLAKRLGADLGLKVGVLDTLENGPLERDAYETGMRRNLKSLQSTLP